MSKKKSKDATNAEYVTANTVKDWKALTDGATVRVDDSGTPVSCDLYVSERGTRHWYTTMENRSDGNGHSDSYMHEVYGSATVLTPATRPSDDAVEVEWGAKYGMSEDAAFIEGFDRRSDAEKCLRSEEHGYSFAQLVRREVGPWKEVSDD